MRSAQTAWVAVIWLIAIGLALPVTAKQPKSAPLDVTHYYLPG